MKYKCLIVDDEPPAIKVLVNYIASVEQLTVVATCHNALKAMEILGKKQVDLLFLDIQMPKLMGIDFLETLHHPPKVILLPLSGNTPWMLLTWMRWIIS